MEDEVMTTAAPESDVIVTANTSPENTAGYVQVQEPTVDPSQSSAITADQPTPPAPKTERELAYEEINRRQEQNYNNKGAGISDWIHNDYNYNPKETGTLWVAGKINDVKTQMSFLEATLNEDLYSEIDLQKYFFDTNLATARAYAKEKKHETAYGFYRAAEEKAIAEGQLTGWYMPAEAGYMLSQWVLADENLKSGSLSDVEKARAESVRRAVSGWFAANNITERGIECLNSLYLKETIRHNKEMERLQDDANKIQEAANAAQNAANNSNYKVQKETFKFQLAEMERDMGYDLNDDNVIGHTGADAQRFGFYKDQKDWIQNNFDKAFKLWGSDHVRGVLGKDYKKAYNNYLSEIGERNLKESIENNGYLLDESYLNKETYTIVATEDRVKGYNDKHVYTFHIKEKGESVTKAYVKDNNGAYHQIETDSLKLTDGTTIKDKIDNFSKDSIIYDGYEIQVGNITNNTAKEASVKNNWRNYDHFCDGQNNDKKNDFAKKIEEYEAKGYVWDSSKRTGANWDIDAGIVMYNAKENKYISISDIFLDVEEWDGDSSAIKEVTQPAWKVGSTFYEDGSGKYHYMVQNSETIGQGTVRHHNGTDLKTNVYMFVDSEGNAHYYKLGKEGENAYLTNYFTIISEDEARKVNPDIDKKLENVNNYRAGINVKKQETKAGKNQDTIAQEEDKSEQLDVEVTPTTSAADNSKSEGARTVTKTSNTTKSKEVSEKEKTKDEDEVIKDHAKYVTAFEAGEIKAQVEEYDEEMLKQLGVVKV